MPVPPAAARSLSRGSASAHPSVDPIRLYVEAEPAIVRRALLRNLQPVAQETDRDDARVVGILQLHNGDVVSQRHRLLEAPDVERLDAILFHLRRPDVRPVAGEVNRYLTVCGFGNLEAIAHIL